ncbi:unnamed protein product [Laminaria digitata]
MPWMAWKSSEAKVPRGMTVSGREALTRTTGNRPPREAVGLRREGCSRPRKKNPLRTHQAELWWFIYIQIVVPLPSALLACLRLIDRQANHPLCLRPSNLLNTRYCTAATVSRGLPW